MKWYNWIDYFCFDRVWQKPPGLTIFTTTGAKYLERWYLIPKNKVFNLYYHVMHHSDDDRAYHDHRSYNVSIVLSGGYWEHVKGKRIWRAPGSVIFRRAKTPHRIELAEGPHGTLTSCSLFIKFPDIRRWGYQCPQGWVDAAAFNDDSDGFSKAGRGCG